MTLRGCIRREHQCSSVITIRRKKTPATVMPIIMPVAIDCEGSFIAILAVDWFFFVLRVRLSTAAML